MDASVIIANIRSQALVGNTGAAEDIDRIVRYLNKGYLMVYAACAKACPSLYRQTQDVVITAGAGTFGSPVHEVLKVFDKNQNYARLDRRSTDNVEMDDPGLVATGSPVSYDIRFNGLVTYPANATVVRVPYIPVPALLTASSLEAAILVPPVYHEVLEWAALWTMACDERDKLVGSELQFTRDAFDRLMDTLTLFLLGQRPVEETRVQHH